MLEMLQIHGFKCFDSIDIPLRRINLFSGANSSGKSSALQAFLLLCKNAVKNSSPLNGMWLRLGAFDECRNHRLATRAFQVGVKQGEETFQVEFRPANDDDNDAVVSYIHESVAIQDHLNFENRHIYYLSANRIGPEDSYPKNFDRLNFLGNKAEFMVDFLYKNRKREVVPALIADPASITLEHQVNHWLKELFGVKNTIRDLGFSNSLSMELSLQDGRPIRTYHMGSGISFTIGVFICCLAAKPGDVVVIENPEIHLHPRAQSDLMGFLCFVAEGGIQVILETHSDHIFNGVRKAIVKKEIAHTEVAVQFFQRDENNFAGNTLIELNAHGRVVNHLKGLFDQFDDDLDRILGL
uniref:Predicted ATPase n=1 Tax=Candidatus Kentrum sp. MB TaxID=2138164 RepID=A0A450Y028_9GAMM|nr:MAG: Predicted ATPase [Candidatus Kentron sp. MB]VFK34888.1 MAG: Predicted ATPase [Candidatus Kentron sp. MB]VFK77021.1 MAG: Predicted ATPase [Candidatus Kentron sp. MB]